ncbi:TMV resistance protein N-like [Humulus lupulus]|uniref:TMV resistance protein N-like n=1 Tax=Humulus lupulus TaxID=3486 RepID=UPI002B415581|nr:TMV resistance protein N-like [Humulus lupulus]
MELVASSSSSKPFRTPTKVKTKYDVFISFRGEDTRYGFTAHLYDALLNKKVEAYLDEVTLRRGDQISPALLQAIRQSKISVIVFSENYADSPWCLDELVRIMECKEIHGQKVVPVFYHVDPSCVRNQKGTYEAAFVELEQRFKDKMEKVQEWRTALTKAANLSGWNTHQIRSESKLIKTLVEDIINKLKSMFSSSGFLEELAGINRRTEQVESMLCLDSSSDRVVVVGLWGMGGIGKTTLARAVFQKISHHFEGCCFLSNVREEWDNGRKKYELQNKLFSELLDEDSKITKMLSIFDRNRLLSKKVLIVLDDANDPEQLEFLTGDGEWFGLGSRIIITTRDVQLLKNRADEIYKVEGFSFYEAFQHFQKNALRRNIPIAEFTELSIRAVKYADGIPLALQVLMGTLFSNKSKEKWKSVLDDLKDSPNEKIHNVLKISYDGLTEKEKDVFLDIACFFKGNDRSYVEGILRGYDSVIGMRIDNLIDKSLITIEKDSNLLSMHDLVQEMCWQIVFHQSIKEPGKRSRLWTPQDVYHVFKNNKVSAMVEGIFLDVSKIKRLNLSPAVFLEAYNLRLLKIYSSNGINNNKLCFPEGLHSLPDALRLLYWEEYPFKTLPLSFDPEKLVKLAMPNSHVEQLWDGVQPLPNLKVIDLSYSKNLTCIPDLSQAPNLEMIYLDYCINLLPVTSQFQNLEKLIELNMNYCSKQRSPPNLRSVETLELRGWQNLTNIPELKENMAHLDLSETAIEELPSSISSLDELFELKLQNCKGLRSLPASICQSQYLTELNLSGCSSLENLPDLPRTLCYLDVSGTLIDQLPTSIESLPYLMNIYLRDCKRLQSLPTCIYKLKELRRLNLYGCSKFDNFPDILVPMKHLYYLNLYGTAIKELPSSVKNLPNLGELDLGMCENLQFLPRCVYTKFLDLCGYSQLIKWPIPTDGFSSLSSLSLYNCNALEFPDWLGCLSSLENLYLSGKFVDEIPASIKQLSKLKHLGISYWKSLRSLPELPFCLNILNARGCTSLETLSLSRIELTKPNVRPQLERDQLLLFFNCLKLDQNTRNIIIADGQLRIIYMIGKNPTSWVAVCFVAEFEEYNHSRGGLRILFEFQAKTKSGECHKSRCILEIGPYNYEKTTSRIKNDIVNSDHVFMLYEYKSFLACQEIKEAHNVNGVSFSICPIGGDAVTPIHSCRVKTCGIRLLYVEEAQEFGLLIKPDYGRTSKVAEEDDDSSTSIDLSKLSDSTVEEEDVDGFFGDFSSNDCENKIRDSHEPSEITKDDESNVSDLDDSALKKEDCDTPSTIAADIDYFEEGEGSLSLNWFEPISRCHATLNSASTDVKENKQEPTESEITPNSAAKEHEEDVKPSESGSMDSIEANNEDRNSFSNGCFLFLSHIKGICKWFFGNKSGNELNQETPSSSGSVHERLQALEVTIQHLQSENTKLRDQNHQLSQQYLQMPATIPKSPLLESSSPFSMQLPDQNIQIWQYYPQMAPADQNILYYPQTVMTILPPRFPAHPFVQNQHMSQHPQMMMSRPLLGFSSGIPTNQANHQRPSSSSQQ